MKNLNGLHWYCEDVLSGKLKVETIWENDDVLALDHPKPVEPVHVVVIPKKHVSSIMDPQAWSLTYLCRWLPQFSNLRS
jgi:histidine triad (HIT) family protein